MAYRILAAVVCLVLTAPWACAGGGISAERLKELKAAAVFVMLEGQDWSGSGSGFLVHTDDRYGYVATNYGPSQKICNIWY